MMTQRIGIMGFGSYVPSRVMTNEEWSRLVDTDDEWIVSRTGIRERRFAADDESTLDLAAHAAEKAIADAGLTPNDIDEIIVATDTPEVYTPDTAAHLQHRIGARQVIAYDLGGSGCAGFVLALDIARTRVQVAAKRILVVGVEVISRIMDWSDRATCVLFGDAAGAVVVGEGDRVRAEIVAADAGTDGSAADILMVETGGTRRPFTLEAAERNEQKQILMNGREVYRQAVKRMSEAAEKVVSMAGRLREEIAVVIPHQANLRIIDSVRAKLGLREEQVYVNVDRFGNTGSATVPLALAEAVSAGRIVAGDLVVLTAFGAGFHWAAVALEF
ncbi:MAG: beta-ketoacyl-ACP synthase III [Acidimicrobiia bacterium]|nr:MAG: beta-ketoacyl-ACP synthase III [Acidimicrobiia bacterium]